MKKRYLAILLVCLICFKKTTFAQNEGTVIKFANGNFAVKSHTDFSRFDTKQIAPALFDEKYYVAVQFLSLPDKNTQQELKEAGIRLDHYLSTNAYWTSIEKKFDFSTATKWKISSISAIPAFYKIDKKLLAKEKPAESKDDQKLIVVSYFSSLDKPWVEQALKEAGATIAKSKFATTTTVFIQYKKSGLENIAALPFVTNVSLAFTKDKPLNYNNKGSAAIGSVQSVLGRNLNGDGITLGVGDNADISTHIDFTGRLINRFFYFASQHGTHTSGTAAGAGLVNPKYSGAAPKSAIVSQYFSDVIANTPSYVTDYKMVSTNNSYFTSDVGCDGDGQYDISSNYVDEQVQTYDEVLHCIAAGNDGPLTCNPFPTSFATIKSGWQSAKNVLTLGNINASTYQISPTSSRGPLADGRIKPEIVANGSNTVSTLMNNAYGGSSGTSMAAPVATGAVALLQQRYKQLNGGAYAKSALIKALLCNTAQDQGNPGPDFTYGFGLINVRKAVEAMENHQYFQGTIGNAQLQSNNIAVPAGVQRLKVMLYWNDAPALPNQPTALVNDLDLTVIDPSNNTKLPFILNATPAGINFNATAGADHINNIEQVVIDNPASGNYKLNVSGFAVPVNNQKYYVTYQLDMNGVVLEYPFGGETFVPQQNEIIRFNGYGNENELFTLEFSNNNGMNWVTIADNIPAGNQSYPWVVPSEITNTGLIRIKRNNTAFSAICEYPFTILGQPVISSTNVCEGYVQLNWAAVTGATSYDVMQLKDDSMTVIANTASTNYLVSGLANNKKSWFSVRAKNGTSAGRRSLAIGATPNSGACSLPAFNNDLKALAITQPITGREFTGTAPQVTVPIKVTVKNLDNAVSNTAFDISYQINGGVTFTENISPNIPAGGTYTHTFPQHPLGGNIYDIKVWVDKPGDAQKDNDSTTRLVRLLKNPAVVLPSFNGFETTTNNSYTSPTLGIEGDDRLDFGASTIRGRARTFVNTGFARTGLRAITLDQAPASLSNQADSLIETINLSNYNINNNQLRLDFYYRDQGQESYPGNKVWIRGSDIDEWLEAFNQGSDIDHLGIYNKGIVNINAVLLNADPPQNVSTSFQVKFGQQGNTSANNVNPTTLNDDGYTFDDVSVVEAINDIGIGQAISPSQNECALGKSVPITVSVKNYSKITQNNIEVSYSVNGGPVVKEIIPSIVSGGSVNHQFAVPYDFSAFIDYSISFWINLPMDNYKSNDSLLNYAFHNSPVINTFPYLEGFENNNGNWYTKGYNNSWQWGSPAKATINKAANGKNAWVTHLTGNYNNEELSYLYSPCFDLSSLTNPVLSFSHILDTELDFDFTWVEYSTDGGISWQRLGPGPGTTNWYDDLVNKRWRLSNKKWHVASIDIPVNSSSVRFRVIMSSDGGVTQEGVGIDDIHIFEKGGIYTGADATAPPQVANGNKWIHFSSNGKRIASIQPNDNNLGSTTANVYFNKGPIRFGNKKQYFLDRNIVIRPTSNPKSEVTIRYYFTDAEALALMNANGCDDCTTIGDPYESGVTKYSGAPANENGDLADNENSIKQYFLPSDVEIVPFENGYYAEFKVNNFSEFWINDGGAAINPDAPVQLLSFDAVKQDNTTLLKWSTSHEEGTNYFSIERSANGQDFSVIGNQNASNQNNINNYNFIDQLPNKGVNYYRLKVVYNNNTFTYSQTRKIDFNNDGDDITVFPNPTSGDFINIASSGNCIKAILFDAAGKQVKNFPLQGTYNTLELKNISKGIYHLKIFTEKSVYIQKIFIN